MLGVALGLVGAFVWIRREAYIATTPRGDELGIRNNASWDRVAQTDFSPSEAEGEAGEVRPVITVPTPPTFPSQREGEKPNTDGASSQSLTPRLSSFVALPVPFVSQAPFRVWDLPYKEFCEEASMLSLHYWKQGKPTPPADQLDRDLKDIQSWEVANLRTWDDTTADETARILREKFGYTNTKVVRGITIAEMLDQLAHGTPIIVPAAGRELSSPYYKPPGPLYHMLVVIGFDDERKEFITNDVGTNTKGAGFRFTYDDLYGAMGDWDVTLGAPDTSKKVMIVVE
ncbi:C39 family peptidase [Candidatus Uhrbacteria bacterium]|nr:C39 family peptidase [Candidatus Uhrbacteria bacterium]